MPPRIVRAKAAPGQPTRYTLSLQHYATYRYAQEFYRTAQKARSPLVRGYLLGHALELFLKSFLLKAGVAAKVLKSRKYGHNLVQLLADSKVQGLSRHLHISAAAETDLVALNSVYPEALRYFSLTQLFVPQAIPNLARLFRLAQSLNTKLASHVAVEA